MADWLPLAGAAACGIASAVALIASLVPSGKSTALAGMPLESMAGETTAGGEQRAGHRLLSTPERADVQRRLETGGATTAHVAVSGVVQPATTAVLRAPGAVGKAVIVESHLDLHNERADTRAGPFQLPTGHGESEAG